MGLGIIAIAFKLTCPLAQQNGIGARIITSAVFLTVGIGLIVHVRRVLPKRSILTPEALEERFASLPAIYSPAYEVQLHAAQAEIDQDEIGDTIDEVAEFLGAHQSHEDAEQISAAAIAAEGLTEIFASLGPPPPGLTGKYGHSDSGSDDGVGAGPRGRNA